MPPQPLLPSGRLAHPQYLGARKRGIMATDAGGSPIVKTIDDLELVTVPVADASYAPLDPSFVVIAAHATLPNERVLTAGEAITVTDSGPGAAVTLKVTDGGITAAKLASDSVTTVKILDDNVTNAKLANMVESRIKGRAVGAGTGDPTDLTGTQATAILDNVVGDSGAGGTKGLVPAPAAGDTAAGKFLKANGTWVTPPDTDTGITQLTGDVTAGAGSGSQVATLASKFKTRVVNVVFDGGGAVLTVDLKAYLSCPLAGTITSWRLLAKESGSLVVGVWKDTYANYPPTSGDSITATFNPELSSAIKAEDTDLGNWSSVTITAGDVLAFNVNSVTTVTWAVLQLQITLT